MIYLNGQATAEFVPEIADNLTTDDSAKALSAKQGKVLNEKTADDIPYSSGVSVKDKIDAVAIKYTDITETTDSSGRILISSDVATTDNFISAIPLTAGSVFIKVAKRYNAETATAVWLFFVDDNNSAIASTSIKFRVFHI